MSTDVTPSCEHFRHHIRDGYNPHAWGSRDEPRRFTCSGCGAVVDPVALLAQQMRRFRVEAPDLYEHMMTEYKIGETFPEVVVGDSVEAH